MPASTKLLTTLFLALMLSAKGPVFSQVKLPRLISNGMVLQHGVKLKLWGWAGPGERVTLLFKGKKYSTQTDSNGHWLVRLPPQQAGGPFEMVFAARDTLTVKDILFGDVWLCSGQSNMELPMARVQDKYPELVATANNRYIRQFEVPDIYNFEKPAEDLPSGQWLPVTPGNIMKFSAVAYFFARDVYARHKIPIGLVNAALGGSPAEAWISEEALKSFPASYAEVQKFKNQALINEIEAADRKASGEWYSRLNNADSGQKQNWQAPDLDDADWHQMEVPGYWAAGPLGNINGVVWFRKSIEVPREMAVSNTKLLLGRIVDADSVFINGVFAGTTSYQYPPRRYLLPAGILHPGKNSIVVRVVSNAGRGGFVPDKPYALVTGRDTLNLGGTWKYRLGAAMPPSPGQTFIRWKPAGLFNAMIAPLLNYAIRGVAWYQGEANTGKPAGYFDLMRALIGDWRSRWGRGNFPFLFVQLPNFMEPNTNPSESNWAALRQSQLETLSLPNTGMAVAIDLGEWNDIHPLNKQEVGHRLALQAERLAYGNKKIAASGPLYQSVLSKGNRLVISFTNTDGGLMAAGNGELHYFSIAGDDGLFVWANAKITGNKVVVWNDSIAHPRRVRYAWADNPEGANLRNKSLLPASPFEARMGIR